MEQPATTLASASHSADVPQVADQTFARAAAVMLLLAAAGVPLSLLWDFSWESTIGIDRVSALPHTATYAAVALAGLAGLMIAFRTTRDAGVRLGRCSAPMGAWLALWGALLFPAAFVFDRWWQF